MSAPAYLLAGEEFLVEEALDEVRTEARADPLSEVEFVAGDDVSDVVEALATSSLLGGTRLVILRDAHDLRKADADVLAAYLEQPSPDSVLVLVASARTRLDAAVRKHGTVVALEAPKGRRLIAWIRRRAGALGLQVDDRAAWALVDAVSRELRDVDAALQQLVLARGRGARIGTREIREAFPRSADERIYAFTDAVGDRRIGLAMTSLRRLLDQGEPPLVLFGALTGHVRRMLRARRHAEQGPHAVGEWLGLPDWRAERLARQALAYKEEELVSALNVLAAADVDMKSGEAGPPQVVLERAVVRVVGG